MNEYLLTSLGDERRHELLAEARRESLARIAREGQQTWWQHLAALLSGAAGGRRPERRHRVHRRARLAH